MHKPQTRDLVKSRRGRAPSAMLPAVAVTSKDIARKLRISQSTVSRALRGDPRVAADTAARVLEAARQMNYTPNLAARSLITRRTGTVGVVVERHHEPVLPGAPRHPAQRARARRLPDDPLQRADGRERRAARGRARQRRRGRRARLRLGDARHAAPGHGARDLPVVLVNRYIDVRARGHGRLRQLPGRPARRRGDGRARAPADRADRRAREHDDEPRPRARLPGAARRRAASGSTRRSAASASSATTAATSGASTSSPRSPARRPSSPRTT